LFSGSWNMMSIDVDVTLHTMGAAGLADTSGVSSPTKQYSRSIMV